MPRAFSKIRIAFTNEHVQTDKDGLPTSTFTLEPGVFTDVPEWVTKHPMWAAATKDYKDSSGIDREADVLLIDDPKSYNLPNVRANYVPPVSGTNVSENSKAGTPVKGSSRKGDGDVTAPVTGAASIPAPTPGKIVNPEAPADQPPPPAPAVLPVVTPPPPVVVPPPPAKL